MAGDTKESLRLAPSVVELLICPKCRSGLERTEDEFRCTGPGCGAKYPVVNSIPILIDEDQSVFKIDSYTQNKNTFYERHATEPGAPQKDKRKFRPGAFLPDYACNPKAEENFIKLAGLLKKRPGKSKILVVGGSIFNRGMEPLLDESFELIETDVSFGDRTQLVLDAHSIPFSDASIDAVVAQAVLEHVAEPWTCAAEFARILKPDGLIYAETPFMQQVHAAAYDFTRFTHVGHRRLFRHFSEIESGAVVGPAVALCSAYCIFLTSFSSHPFMRKLLLAMGQLTCFWLKYFDYYLIDKPGALDSAFGYYFLGQRAPQPVSDDEVLASYRGAVGLLKPRKTD